MRLVDQFLKLSITVAFSPVIVISSYPTLQAFHGCYPGYFEFSKYFSYYRLAILPRRVQFIIIIIIIIIIISIIIITIIIIISVSISISRGMADECLRYHSRLAELLSAKKQESYATTLSWIRAKVSFAILRSALLGLRGSRTPRRRNLDIKDSDLEIEKGQAGLP